MAQLESFSIVSEAIVGTAPTIFSASSSDTLAAITTPGYLLYLGEQIKNGDIIYINYADASVFPLNPSASQLLATPSAGMNALSARFIVSIYAGIPTLLPLAGFSGAAQAPVISSFTITAAQLASAGAVTLIASSGSQQYQILSLSAAGVPPSVNFSGGGGNRLGQVTDGTTVYSLVPAGVAPPSATVGMQNLVPAVWGSTELPFPAAGSVFTKTVAGAAVQFKYSGGSADYTAGQIVLTIQSIRVA